MIFKVKNLGYIEEAEVDLSKDLIVFTGHNNTGKTYLAYAIYGLYTLNDFDFEIRYRSIYDDKWRITSKDEIPEKLVSLESDLFLILYSDSYSLSPDSKYA